MDAMTLMANQFGDFSRFNGTTQNIKKKMFFVWRLLISHIIRHCKFVLQGTCTFLKNKVSDMFFSSFFTSWTITGEKCTRAHVQENKSIYIYIYIYLYSLVFIYFFLSLVSVHLCYVYISIYIYMKTFLKTGVYIYIYNSMWSTNKVVVVVNYRPAF